MKELEKRLFILSTQFHANSKVSQRYLDYAHETAGTLVLTRDKRYAKTFKNWREAHDVVLCIWSQYRCALYLKEVPCENGLIVLPGESSVAHFVGSPAK